MTEQELRLVAYLGQGGEVVRVSHQGFATFHNHFVRMLTWTDAAVFETAAGEFRSTNMNDALIMSGFPPETAIGPYAAFDDMDAAIMHMVTRGARRAHE